MSSLLRQLARLWPSPGEASRGYIFLDMNRLAACKCHIASAGYNILRQDCNFCLRMIPLHSEHRKCRDMIHLEVCKFHNQGYSIHPQHCIFRPHMLGMLVVNSGSQLEHICCMTHYNSIHLEYNGFFRTSPLGHHLLTGSTHPWTHKGSHFHPCSHLLIAHHLARCDHHRSRGIRCLHHRRRHHRRLTNRRSRILSLIFCLTSYLISYLLTRSLIQSLHLHALHLLQKSKPRKYSDKTLLLAGKSHSHGHSTPPPHCM